MFEIIFKIGIGFILTALTLPAAAQSPQSAQATVKAAPEFNCAASETLESFPTALRLQMLSVDQIEATASYRGKRDIPTASLKRVEFANQPKTAVFPVTGTIGISGEAKMLIAKDALKYNEVGTIMVINLTMRESAVYQCQKSINVAVLTTSTPIKKEAGAL